MATKIMYLVDEYVGPQAGSEGQLLQLIQHLDRSRFEPAMTVLRASDYIECNAFPCSVRVLGIPRLASRHAFGSMLRFARDLRHEGFHLVHCLLNDSSLIAPAFMRLLGIRVLVSRRDMGFWYTPGKLAALRLVAHFVDRYVVNSHAVKRVVREREWVPDRKIAVIYNGFSPRGEGDVPEHAASVLPEIAPDMPVVGIVANVKPIKRIDVLVEAFAMATLRRPDARLVIVGDTDTPPSIATHKTLSELAVRLGITDRVVFTGRVDNAAPYIERFTLAVLCSESEGFSNAVIEYMQAGRPIVCTDTGGNPELVRDNQNGFLVPVGDIAALTERIDRLLTDVTLARRLGEAARESVRSYTVSRMVSEQMDCYDALVPSA